MRQLLILIAVLFLFACTAPAAGPKFTKNTEIMPDTAVFYLYRQNNLGATVCINVYVNNELRGCLGSKGFLRLKVNPGENIIFTDPNALGSPVEFGFTEVFIAESVKYYKYTTEQENEGAVGIQKASFQKGLLPNFVIYEIEEDKALNELQDLRSSEVTTHF